MSASFVPFRYHPYLLARRHRPLCRLAVLSRGWRPPLRQPVHSSRLPCVRPVGSHVRESPWDGTRNLQCWRWWAWGLVHGEDVAAQALGEGVAPAVPTPRSEAPAFSGKQDLQGSIQDVLTVLRDVPSISQWAYGISRAQLVKRVSGNVDLIYFYSAHPLACSRPRHDRCAARSIELETGIAYRIVLSCQAGIRAPRDGIVRVSECHSEFRLRRLDDRTTVVQYSAEHIDPAGHIPNWTKSWMARTVPGRTLAALQEARHAAAPVTAAARPNADWRPRQRRRCQVQSPHCSPFGAEAAWRLPSDRPRHAECAHGRALEARRVAATGLACLA